MQALVRARSVTKTYGGEGEPVTALDNLSLQVEPGEFLAVTGPSGCGKSTLLHLMGGMDRPTSGEVWLGESPLHALSEEELTLLRRSSIGFVFQFFYLLPTMTVEENVSLPLLLSGRGDRLDKARQLLQQVGMSHRLGALPSTLSGGEMQRVAVARALIQDPVLVLADEPTGNLDSENGRIVLELLRELSSSPQRAVVMATHSREAASLATRQVRIRDGRLVEPCPS